MDLPPRSAPTITQDIVNSQDQKMVAIDIIQQKPAKLKAVHPRLVHKDIPKHANMEKIACTKQNAHINTMTNMKRK